MEACIIQPIFWLIHFGCIKTQCQKTGNLKGNRYITHLMVFLAVTAISCYDTTLNQINLHAVKLTGKTQAQFNHDKTSYTYLNAE